MARGAEAAYSNEADYVVVGSGSSGAAIAGRLAQSGASVIVLEAGKSDEQFLVKKPGMIGPMHSVPQIKKHGRLGLLLGAAEAPPRPQDAGPARQGRRRLELDQRHGLRARQPRQLRLLGGRGQHRLGRRQRQRGVQAHGGLRGRRERLPRRRRADPGHPQQDPAGGVAAVPPGRPPTPSAAKILDDYNAESQEGVSRMQQNAADGLRYSASRGYIHHLAPADLRAAVRDAGHARSSSRTAARSASRSPTSARRAPARRGPSAPARRSSSRPASSAPRSC